MFCIGKIKEFKGLTGVYATEYGFIHQISPKRNDDVYFRVDGIFKDSSLKDNVRLLNSNPYVGYFLTDDIRKPGSDKAVWVIPVDEINPDILFKLIDSYDLGGKELTSVLKKQLDAHSFGNDPMEYLRFINDDSVRRKLIQKAENQELDYSFCNAIENSLKKWESFTDNIEVVISLPVYRYENKEDVESLCKRIRTISTYHDLTPILRNMPRSFLLREDMAKLINRFELEKFMKSMEDGREEFAEEIAPLIKDKEKIKVVIKYLPLKDILLHKEYCEGLSDDKIANMLEEYLSIPEDDIDNIKELLSVIEPISCPSSAVTLGDIMLVRGLPINLWKMLSEAEKTWLILYLSFHLDSKETWKESFSFIYKYENEKAVEEKNCCVLAVLEFLKVAFARNFDELGEADTLDCSFGDDTSKQSCFDNGHDYLLKAIKNDYLKNYEPSNELMQLLCRCKEKPSNVCPAKYYKNGNTAWCNTRRGICNLFDSENDNEFKLDYNKTYYASSKSSNSKKDLCKISMADLFINIGYTPDLGHVYNPKFEHYWSFEEYPYRISGRILQLNRLISHMFCKCGKLMESNFAYAIKVDANICITRAYCGDAATDANNTHDPDAYLNECWNCHEVVDSRDSKFLQTSDGHYYRNDGTDRNGFFVCMKCGAGYKGLRPAICPDCGCTVTDLLDIKPINQYKSKLYKCKKCGFNTRYFKSEYERNIKSQIHTSESVILGENFGFTAVETDELPFL